MLVESGQIEDAHRLFYQMLNNGANNCVQQDDVQARLTLSKRIKAAFATKVAP